MLKSETLCGLLCLLVAFFQFVSAYEYSSFEEYVRFDTEGNYTAAVGTNFTVMCRSNTIIKLARRLAQNATTEDYVVGDYVLNDDGLVFTKRITLTDLTYKDVGWFDCTAISYQPTKASFYLFVDDPVHLMVGPRVTRVFSRPRKPFEVPCHPTTPDVNVNLLTSEGDPINFSTDPEDENTDKFYYHPTRGFILPAKLMTAYCYIYTCEFTKRGVKQRNYVDVFLDGGGGEFVYLERQFGNKKSKVSAKPGSYVTFVAEVFTNYKPEILWYDVDKHQITTSKKFTIAHELGEPWETRLTIHNVTSTDAGFYTVTAPNHQEITFTLQVEEAQPLDIEMETVYLISNDNFAAFCRDTSLKPMRELTWTFKLYNCQTEDVCETTLSSLNTSQDVDDVEFNPKIPYAILFNNPVLANITCSIEYMDKTMDSVTRPLIVSEARDGFEIKHDYENFILGRTVELTCIVSRFLYSNNVYWIGHDGFVIEYSRAENGRNITITRSETVYSYQVTLTIEMDENYTLPSEEYRCMAVNYQHEPSFKNHELNINSGIKPLFLAGTMKNASVFLAVEEDLTLTCFFGGVPFPTLHWYKDDTKLANNGHQNLELHLTLNDSGHYSCLAANDFGKDYMYTDVKVYVPVPVSINDTGEGWILGDRLSERVTLLCADDGEPAYNFTWFRDDEKVYECARIILRDNGSVLEIFPVEAEDSGFYTCRPGTHSHEKQPIVQDSPRIVAPVLGSICAVLVVFAVIYLGMRYRRLKTLKTPISYHNLFSMRT